MATSTVDTESGRATLDVTDYAALSPLFPGESGPPAQTSRRGISRTILLWVAVFIVLTAWSAVRVVDLPDARVPGVRWWIIWIVAAHQGVLMTSWLFVTFSVSERLPVSRPELWQRLGIHTLVAFALAAVGTAEFLWYRDVAPLDDPRLRNAWLYFLDKVSLYPFLAGLAHALVYARRYWQVRAATERLRTDLAEAGRHLTAAELRALKAEVNPHFLGSALDAIARSFRSSPTAAERVLAELGGLVRTSITRAHTQEVTLREELETLEPFIDVERARLGWRFEVETNVDPSALDACVPDMILPPMVETAVRRGLACYPAGRIRISARRIGQARDLLEICVGHEGAGSWIAPQVPLAPPTAASWVANARARLAELYGARATLEVPSASESPPTAHLRLTIPWRDENAEEPTSDPPHTESVTSSATDRASWSRRIPLTPVVSLLVLSVLQTFVHLERPTATGVRVPVPLSHAIPAGVIAAAVMIAIGCIAFRLARRYPPGAPLRGRALLAHAKAAVVLAVIGSAVRFASSYAAGYLLDGVTRIRVVKVVTAAVGTAAGYVMLYGMLTVVAYAVEYARRYRRAQAAARLLRDQIAETGRRRTAAELRALKAELNPHFLGNALHTISALLRTDADAAQRVLDQLSSLVRMAVVRSQTNEVTLREELETLEPYLALEQARLGQGLRVSWDVDENLLDAQVPHMILQPLVENAVKHGLAPRRAPGHIEFAAGQQADRLEVLVRDDGIGLAGDGAISGVRGNGVGLTNARARLAQLYGEAAYLELAPNEAGGTIARLSVPWRFGDASHPRTPLMSAPS